MLDLIPHFLTLLDLSIILLNLWKRVWLNIADISTAYILMLQRFQKQQLSQNNSYASPKDINK